MMEDLAKHMLFELEASINFTSNDPSNVYLDDNWSCDTWNWLDDDITSLKQSMQSVQDLLAGFVVGTECRR